MKTTLPALACVLVAIAGSARAQDVQSGPSAGMKLTEIKVYASSGPYKGKEFDVAAEIGGAPGAVLFVKTINRETAPIIRSLDTMSLDYGLLGFKAFSVMLTDDRTHGEERTRTISRSIAARNPMTVSLDGAEGPGNYAINRDVSLTLVMVKDGAVTRSLSFTDTGQKDVPRVQAAIEAVTGPMPKTAADLAKVLPDDPRLLKSMVGDLMLEVQRLKKQMNNMRERNRRNRNQRRPNRNRDNQGMRRGQNAERKPLAGKIPDSAEMQGLIRRLIRAKEKSEVDAVFTAVDQLVGSDAQKRQDMVEGFRRILATTYGTEDARARAKAYIEKHGKKSKTKESGESTSRPARVRRDD